jgi:hypothetical protein
MNKAIVPRVRVYKAPKTAAGRLFAAQVWDRLAEAYGQPISPALREAFVAELNAGEARARAQQDQTPDADEDP